MPELRRNASKHHQNEEGDYGGIEGRSDNELKERATRDSAQRPARTNSLLQSFIRFTAGHGHP